MKGMQGISRSEVCSCPYFYKPVSKQQTKLTLFKSRVEDGETSNAYFRGSCKLGLVSSFKLIKGSLCLLSSEAEAGADLKLMLLAV